MRLMVVLLGIGVEEAQTCVMGGATLHAFQMKTPKTPANILFTAHTFPPNKNIIAVQTDIYAVQNI